MGGARRGGWGRGLGGIAGAVLLGYLFYLGLLYVQQRQMMFPGAGREFASIVPAPGVAQQEVELEARFGTVRGVFLPAANREGPAPAMLYFHGNAETVGHNVERLARVAELGIDILLVEYPGYAGTDGSPSRASLMEAARLAHDWLQARSGVTPGAMLAMGRSIGSGPAVEIAVERELGAVVLLAGFTSTADFARRFGAPGFLVRDAFDNRRLLEQYQGEVLLFHGRRDRVVPYRHSEQLAAASPNAQLVTLDCHHNDCPYFDPMFIEILAGFLVQHGLLADRGHRPARIPVQGADTSGRG